MEKSKVQWNLNNSNLAKSKSSQFIRDAHAEVQIPMTGVTLETCGPRTADFAGRPTLPSGYVDRCAARGAVKPVRRAARSGRCGPAGARPSPARSRRYRRLDQ
ncbi:hypothetical protein EVAR_44929_1 [Eumeta japonica]|uniref:Uncharacterized protein n=1 Tax=Eumeta variegata TaxID=151549 RepID=A0A4C2ABS9_EUMVA|nr:hypothetical protein EVAR_44929_1 [Eumeta japonica]